jgi:beta-glucosidase
MMEEADIVIYACGERIRESGEAHNRSYIKLPRKQNELYTSIEKHAKKIITIIIAGRPLSVEHLKSSHAILYGWFPGSEGAHAIADTLLGTNHPSGKLPMSFPRHEGQIPVYYNHLNTGRPRIEGDHNEYTSYYLDTPNTPLYPFGYGLTYTTWELSEPKIEHATMVFGDSNTLSVTLRNTGKRVGMQVVQVYVRDVVSWVSRPVKALKAHQKIELQPGETKVITFDISSDWFTYYNEQGIKTYEPGEFLIMVGLDSSQTKNGHIHVKKGQ